ncbi:MAG: hypothetical protein KC800_06635, partial [Candidatus Eremiobacteraeota bacterium]|nr:hypothetical protein [Candidatus Eremiobacteraeota bacterium]
MPSGINQSPQNRPSGQVSGPKPTTTKAAAPQAKTTPGDTSGVRAQTTAALEDAPSDTPSNRRAGTQLTRLQTSTAAAVTGPVKQTEDRPVPKEVVENVGSEEEKTRAEGFTYLSDRAAKGDRTALDFIRRMRSESKDYDVRDEATGALLSGEEFLTKEDYQSLLKSTVFDSDVKKRVMETLSRGVAQDREGAADVLRDSIKNDTYNGEKAMDPLVIGLGDRIGPEDYRLVLSRLHQLGPYGDNEATKKSVVEAIKTKQGGVAEEIDRQLSQPFEKDYNQGDRVKNGLRLQAEGNKEHQPPQALFDNLDKLREKDPSKARDLLEHAFAASSRPEELGAYAHHLIDGGYLQQGDSEEKVMKAVQARLKEGGREPVLAARKVFSSERPSDGAERRAIQIYQMAPEMLEKEDVAVLAKLSERGQRLGVDAEDVAKTLGLAGQHAKGETLDAIKAELRKGMEHKDPRVRDAFAQALKGMSGSLGGEDLMALTDKLDLRGSTGAVIEGVEHADKETRRAVLDKVRGNLVDDRGYVRDEPA